MGTEIQATQFGPQDEAQFRERLRDETRHLMGLFRDGAFDDDGDTFGIELEAWLVDRDFLPAPVNERFLEAVNDPTVVPELSQYNFEINVPPSAAGPHFLSELEESLAYTWRKCCGHAEDLDACAVMIGIMPTVRDDMLRAEFISPLNRYAALNDRILEMRRGQPLRLSIVGDGEERLESVHGDVLIEAAATSLQIHIKTRPDEAVRYFNSAMIASAPVVAAAANSPFLFGKDLWDETRIPLFEQAVHINSYRDLEGNQIGRVKFGEGYCRNSLLELFLENMDRYPPLLPMVEEADIGWLQHLRLQNGTIWRWNRPIIGVGPRGRYHLRVEHRVAAAGPTVTDTIANTALSIGLINHLAQCEAAPEASLSCTQARANFYAAAKHGMRARIEWLDGRTHDLQHLLLDTLIPQAEKALLRLGVSAPEVEHYLRDVIHQRVLTGRGGAAYQRSFVSVHGRDFQALVQAYAANMSRNMPVHLWHV